MQDYLRTNIKFPTHKDIPVKDWASRLTQINGKLLRFPHQQGSPTVLSDQEIKSIIFKAMPESYKTKLHLTGKNLYQYEFDDLVEFFEIVRLDARRNTKTGLSTAGKPKHRNQRTDNKKKISDSTSKTQKFCKHCKENNAPDWIVNNHYPDKCNDPTGKKAKGFNKKTSGKKTR